MAKPPSSKQLGYLKGLGYRLTPPESSREASLIIDSLKGGSSPEDAEKELLSDRQKRHEVAIASQREYLSAIRQMNQGAEEWQTIGFKFSRIVGEKPSPEDAIYVGAFLSLELAEKHPDLLLVNLDYDEVTHGDRKPKKIIEAPGRVVERLPGQPLVSRKSAKDTSGCLLQAMFLCIAILVAWFS